MSGVKGRSGRRRLPTRIVADAITALSEKVPELLDALEAYALGAPMVCEHCGKPIKAKKVDPDAIIYLIDRAIGRPKQESKVELSASISMAPEDYEMAVRAAQMAEIKLLADPDVVEGEASVLPDNTAMPAIP
jgi:hypothetical protein